PVPQIVLAGTPVSPTIGTLLFNWTNSNTAIGLPSSGTGDIPTFTANNTSITPNEPITSTVIITPTINGCSGTSVFYTITINPKPIAVAIDDITVCPGESVGNIILTASSPNIGAGTTFTWSAVDNAAIGQFVSSGTTPIPSFTAENSTNATISSTFTVIPTFAGCTGNSETFTISVLPVSVGGTATATSSPICSGDSTTITLTGYTGSIQWQTNATGSFVDIPSETTATYTTLALTNSTSYRAIVTSGTCSSSISSEALVTVNPTNVGGTATATSSTICSIGSTTITLTGYTGNIQWQTNATGSFVDILSETSATYNTTILTSSTSYRAIVTSGVCSSDTSTEALVTVNPTSVGGTATATSSTICSGSLTTITLTGYTGSIQWQTNSTGSFIDIPSATSATYNTPALTSSTSYRAIVTSGTCSPSTSSEALVTVNPTSVGGTATATSSTICSGGSTTITLTGYTGSIQWQTNATGSFVDIPIEINATYNTPVLANSTSYRAIVTSGVCSPDTSSEALVTVDPTSVGGTATETLSTICSGGSTTITLTSYTGSIQWQTNATGSFIDIPTETNATYSTPALTNSTKYRAIVTSGVCGSDISSEALVTVDSTSVGGIAVATSSTICLGGSTLISLTGYIGNIQWQTNATGSFVDIPTETNATYSTPALTNSTSYRAIVASGVCSSDTSTVAVVTVAAIPTLISSLTPPTICSGSSFNYAPISDISGTTFTWTRDVQLGISNIAGAGSGPLPIDEILINTSTSTVSVTYKIFLLTSVGCTNTVNIVVDVDPVPDTASTISGTQTVCDGASGNVYTVAPILNATSYMWTLPNASTVSTTTNTITINYLVGEGSGNLSVHGVNSCGSGAESVNYPITIIPPPTLSSSLTPPDVCSGQSFSYSPTSTVFGATFTWVRNAVAGISNIVALGTNGITETLVNTTNNPIDVTYTYTIKTPSPELCENTQNITVTINPLPVLTSTTTPPDICSGTIFNYIPTSSVSGTTFSWTRFFVSGIAESTSSNNPGNISETLTNTTDTTISVTYIISQTTPDGCTTTPVNIVVDVNPIPLNASIISGPPRVCAGSVNNVYTITTLQNIDKYVWALPNGSTVETPTPTITLSAMAGNLSVYARNSCGNGVASNLAISIIASPTLSSSLTPADICSGSAFVYTATSSTDNATFSWTRAIVSGITNSYGSGVGATINEVLTNETNSPIPVVYTFTITTPEGCENTQDITVIVSRPVPPNATIITGPQSICIGSTNHVYTVDPIPYATTYEWTLPNLTTLTTTNSTITINATAGTLSVFGKNSCGDGGKSNLTIAVIAAPTLTSTLSPTDLCSGDTFEYTPASITFGATFSWTRASTPGISNIGTSGNGAITPASNETLINTTNTPIDVVYNYTITTLEGCENTQPVTVTVNPLAILTSSFTPPDICSGSAFNYTPSTSIAGTTFTWTRAAVVGITEGNNSGATDINEVLTNETPLTIPVTYIITLTTPDGCISTQSIVIDVNHDPLDATTISGPQRVCVASTGNVYTVPTIPNATSYVWTLPNTLIIETVLPTISIDAMSGNLSVHGKNSCSNGIESALYPITIVATPALSSDLTPADICSGDSFEYIPTSLTTGTTFSWTRAVVTGISNTTGSGNGAITPASNEVLINETNTPKNVVYSFTSTTPEG
ncbi:MAG: hypothetical protein JKY16_06195, partial [Lutibacter sp.]|nr:hypothetical protein [Lutibacter sp.]